MKPATTFATALVLSLTAVGLAAQVEEPPSIMSRGDFLALEQAIRIDSRLALARCRRLAEPRDRAVCRAEARAGERVAAASLEATYRGTFGARAQAQRARARAVNELAIARRLAAT